MLLIKCSCVCFSTAFIDKSKVWWTSSALIRIEVALIFVLRGGSYLRSCKAKLLEKCDYTLVWKKCAFNQTFVVTICNLVFTNLLQDKLPF